MLSLKSLIKEEYVFSKLDKQKHEELGSVSNDFVFVLMWCSKSG